VNDAVDRVIMERAALDHGLPGSLMLSLIGHAVLVGIPLIAALLLPREPPIKIMDGFAVALPRGGGGTPHAAPPAPQPTAAPPVTTPEQPKEEPAPKQLIKPPKDEPKKGLPELDAKKGKKPKAEASPTPRAGSGSSTGTGTSSAIPGLSLSLPPGPGVADGVDVGGDWYLASVQQKIWMLWTQQVKTGFNQAVTVSFTIVADGSVEDVQVIQSSGATLLDLAAKRAVMSAGPFAALPKTYGTNRYTIQAVFRPTQ
jgi:TonB family protein